MVMRLRERARRSTVGAVAGGNSGAVTQVTSAFSLLKVLTLRPILAAWPRSPNRRSRSGGAWSAKAVWSGNVEAPDEAAAIEKAAAEFRVSANRLMAIRR
jgi:hypothetical protein